MQAIRKPWVKGLVALALCALQITFGLPLVVGTAQAQSPIKKPRVWVAPILAGDGVAGASMLAEKIDSVIRKQLGNSRSILMWDEGHVGPVAAGETDPRVEEAEGLRFAGKEAFANGKYDAAIASLSAAVENYEAGMTSLVRFETFLETLGYLGAASLAGGYEADAKDYFKRVLVLMPDAEPLDEYSADAKKLFNKLSKKLAKKKRGSLRISTRPKGAVVYVDGVEIGPSPKTIKKLPKGYHYVRAVHPEAGLAGRKVKVKGKRPVRVDLKLEAEVGPEAPEGADDILVKALLATLRQNNLGAGFKRGASEIAQQTQAQYLLFATVSPEGNGFVLNAFLYGATENQVAAFDRMKFRADVNSATVQGSKLAKLVEKAAKKFPFEKVLVGGTFVKATPKAPPPMKVQVAEPPLPEPTPELKYVAPEPVRPVAQKPIRRPRPTPEPTNPAFDVPEEPESDDAAPITSKWWFWAATAATFVAAGVGSYMLYNNDPDSFNAEVTW